MKFIKDLWKAFVGGYLAENKRRKSEAAMEYNRKRVELTEFCPIGDRFYYLDTPMLCLHHKWYEEGGGEFIGIYAEYLNIATGGIEVATFQYVQLEILKKENERYKQANISPDS